MNPLEGRDRVTRALSGVAGESGDGLDAHLGTTREGVQLVQRHYVQFFGGCGRVVDLGCGPGYFMELLREAGIGCSGVDERGRDVERCLAAGLAAECAELEEYLSRASASSADGVFCAHVIEHLEPRKAASLMAGTARLLRPGGIAVFVTPNPGALFTHLDQFWSHPGHVRFYHASLLRHLALEAGLEVVTAGEHPPGNPLFGGRLPRIRQLSAALASPRQAAAAANRRGDLPGRLKASLRARLLGVVAPWIDQLSRELAEIAEFAADVAETVDRPPESYLVARARL